MSVLETPVDHRLRDIIRELMRLNEAPSSASPPSKHCDRLRQLSQSLSNQEWLITEDEVNFACYLAEPAVQGGIVVALMQPSKCQEYTPLTNDVVESCITLRELRELAEFFSLPSGRLSIFDAFPFITKTKLDGKDVDHIEFHATFHEIILEKRPTMALSGWMCPYFRNYETRNLQKQAIGTLFLSP